SGSARRRRGSPVRGAALVCAARDGARRSGAEGGGADRPRPRDARLGHDRRAHALAVRGGVEVNRVAERVFAGFALFLATSALFPLLQGGGESTLVAPPTDARLTIASLVVYAIAIALVARRRAAVLELV